MYYYDREFGGLCGFDGYTGRAPIILMSLLRPEKPLTKFSSAGRISPGASHGDYQQFSERKYYRRIVSGSQSPGSMILETLNLRNTRK